MKDVLYDDCKGKVICFYDMLQKINTEEYYIVERLSSRSNDMWLGKIINIKKGLNTRKTKIPLTSDNCKEFEIITNWRTKYLHG